VDAPHGLDQAPPAPVVFRFKIYHFLNPLKCIIKPQLPVNNFLVEVIKLKLLITISQDEDGVYIAECPAIPGCVSQGQTEAEAEKNIHEAIIECLSVRAEKGLPLTVPTRQIEVEVEWGQSPY
jgi:predicted RNase H-like HicB family nuclease